MSPDSISARAQPADVADLHIPDAPIGTAETLAHKIVAAWPEAGFTITQDPRYEYAGIQLRLSPDTGMCAHHVDGEGDPFSGPFGVIGF